MEITINWGNLDLLLKPFKEAVESIAESLSSIADSLNDIAIDNTKEN